MTEIPADVGKQGLKVAAEVYNKTVDSDDDSHSMEMHEAGRIIARAIMAATDAERERCAKRYAFEAANNWLGRDKAASIRFDGLLVITHPDMPAHFWDGENMRRIEISVDPAK